MIAHVADDLIRPLVPFGTSGGGELLRAFESRIRIGSAHVAQGTTVADPEKVWLGSCAVVDQTSSGVVFVASAAASSVVISELRRRSGFTWEQLARLFGVARRSVHFWASGKPMNAANGERLGRLLAVVRFVDRGSAQATRSAFITSLPDGVIPFDLLVNDEFDEVMRRLGPGQQRPMQALAPISRSAWTSRLPSPPGALVGALQDNIHRETGRSRSARAARVESRDRERR